MPGGKLFGLLGVILAVPTIAVAKVFVAVVAELYKGSSFYRGEDVVPTATSSESAWPTRPTRPTRPPPTIGRSLRSDDAQDGVAMTAMLGSTVASDAADRGAVTLSTPEQTRCRIEVVRRAMPRRGGTALLYRCPRCQAPRRYLYGLALIGGGIVEDGLWRCRQCAGLLFVSQGRYHRQFQRAMLAAFYGPDARIREPLPRHPWDPQAVSDPRMLVDEFPDHFHRASSLRYRS